MSSFENRRYRASGFNLLGWEHINLAMKRSPLGLDLYLWLVYRTFPLRAPLRLTWRQVYRQFGVNPGEAVGGQLGQERLRIK